MTMQKSGVSDPTFDVISIMYHCLQSIETGQRYLQDLKGDAEMKEFISKYIQLNRQCAEEGKQVLMHALTRECHDVQVKGKR